MRAFEEMEFPSTLSTSLFYLPHKLIPIERIKVQFLCQSALKMRLISHLRKSFRHDFLGRIWTHLMFVHGKDYSSCILSGMTKCRYLGLSGSVNTAGWRLSVTCMRTLGTLICPRKSKR